MKTSFGINSRKWRHPRGKRSILSFFVRDWRREARVFRNVDVRGQGFCKEVRHVCILDNLYGSLHNDSQEVKARYMIVSVVLREKGWESYIP